MGMKIEKSFAVAAPRATVWSFLVDPYRVASCLPGAAITGKIDDQTYAGTLALKVGPVTASYKGKLRFERLDEAAGEAELSGAGQETKGKGGADMRMTSRVVERAPGETEVTVVSDVNVFGILAQMGRGMIQDVSDQLFAKFAEAATAEILTAVPPSPTAIPAGSDPVRPPEAPIAAPAEAPTTAPRAARPDHENVLDVGSIGAAAAKRAAARAVTRPGFWLVVALLALALYWLTR